MKKRFASFQTRQKQPKRRYLGNYASKSLIFERNSMSGPGEGLGIGPGAHKRRKSKKVQVLAPVGLVTLIDKKRLNTFANRE